MDLPSPQATLQQEELGIISLTTRQPFPGSKVFYGFLLYESLIFFLLLSAHQFFFTTWVMTTFLNKVQYW